MFFRDFQLIPPFDDHGRLPDGLHDASISEIRQALGFTTRREALIDGLERYLADWDSFRLLESVVIDGSFVTDKPEPGDIDLLVVPHGGALIDPRLGRVVMRLCFDRRGTKREFGCEAFIVHGSGTADYREWLGFFSRDRAGNSRGLLKVRMPL